MPLVKSAKRFHCNIYLKLIIHAVVFHNVSTLIYAYLTLRGGRNINYALRIDYAY